MINKMFSYSRRGIPLGREGREKGKMVVCVGRWRVERERARMELGRLRKRYEGVEGRERVKGK